MEEIWKDVPQFEGLYQVSNLGRVKSFRKSAKFGGQSEYILKPSLMNNGYFAITCYGNGKRIKMPLHRLVASVFLQNPDPDNCNCVNHKDEDRNNNAASNLEWCTYKYNNNYGTARKRIDDTISFVVEQYDANNNLIAIYRSARTAASIIGISKAQINAWIRTGEQAKGCYWKKKRYHIDSVKK